MEKRRKYTNIIMDFFKSTPEIAITTFCREIKFDGAERLRNGIYKGYPLNEDDIYYLIYHLSKFRIQDPEGWTLIQDKDSNSIFATKTISSTAMLCNELKNGETIRRPITPEMEEMEDFTDEDGNTYQVDAWSDPYADQIASTWFEYDTREHRHIITCYEELNS